SGIAKMFGDGHSQEGAFEANQGRLVGSGHHDHRFAASGLIQIIFQKLADLAPPLPDQRDDIYVGLRLAGNHAQQSGLPYSTAREDAQPLPPSAGSKSVDGFDGGAENLRDALPLEGVRWQKV